MESYTEACADVRLEEAPPADLQAIWEQLRRRNDWKLVDDEQRFLAQVWDEARRLAGVDSAHLQLRLAIQRVYSARLYEGLRLHQSQAAHELWLAVFRTTLACGWECQRAEEVAQETLLRVLGQLDSLRTPQSLLSWSLLIANTVRRAFQTPDSLPAPGSEPAADPPDPWDLANAITGRIVRQTLVALLEGALSNDLERRVLLAWVLEGLPPRDIARELGLPLHRTRLAKHRALQRVRNNPAVLRTLATLLDRDPDR